ncbi:MAG TPA: prolyl oligopeptidase family serine peptidase, partial [Caldilineaceae bacterium]|nr:prolyl oligopeptidase family serine peptidase [Caldilineaceae bacterium]
MTEPKAGATTTGTTAHNESPHPNSSNYRTTDRGRPTKASTAPQSFNATPPYHPTIRDLILLDLPTDLKVSPSGQHVAVTVRTTNWRDNCYESRCYLYNSSGDSSYLVSRTGSVQQVAWLDDHSLALLKTTGDGNAQIFLYEGIIGDGWQVTEQENGVHWFAPFAGGFLYRADRSENHADKERMERFGNYRHFEQEESCTALFYVSLAALRDYERQRCQAPPSEGDTLIRPVLEVSRLLAHPYAIRSAIPCPTGRSIYLNCWRRDDLVYYNQSSNFHLAIDPEQALATYLQRKAGQQCAGTACHVAPGSPEEATTQSDATQPDDKASDWGALTQIPLPIGAEIVAVSPDGESLLIDHQGRDNKIYTRSDLWFLAKSDALQTTLVTDLLPQMRNLSAPLDRDLFHTKWTAEGIFAAYVDGTHVRLTQLTVDGTITPLDLQGHFCTGAYDIGKSGHLGLLAVNETQYTEVWLASGRGWDRPLPLRQLTDYGATLRGWQLGTVETIRWLSKDGTEIEGVLRKPANFDPNRRYPLVFVVHGGPTGYADASLLTHPDRTTYPAIQFANADILVLYPNYRGSTGRGQAFTELNVNNLGIGDLWDLESAIDHLATLGWIDESRIGCMGWSQGGYISAFAGLHSERFRCVSVGAGISDWYTYHISNDIPYFTTDYLSGSPFRNRELYDKTAPMSNLAN